MSTPEILAIENGFPLFFDCLGYGNPLTADFWFIGLEEAGVNSSEDAQKRHEILANFASEKKYVWEDGPHFTLDVFDFHGALWGLSDKDLDEKMSGDNRTNVWKMMQYLLILESNGEIKANTFMTRSEKSGFSSLFLSDWNSLPIAGTDYNLFKQVYGVDRRKFYSPNGSKLNEGRLDRIIRLIKEISETEKKVIIVYSQDKNIISRLNSEFSADFSKGSIEMKPVGKSVLINSLFFSKENDGYNIDRIINILENLPLTQEQGKSGKINR